MSEVNEKPLVTFALFAYNQEKYIREAVEGAFSQTYEPLEIILSDDCSTDRTFEIMQEMVAGYDGQHRVLVRQNNKNLGLADHINSVVEVARGQVLVIAAGDDVSRSDRVKTVASIFMKYPDTAAVFSAYGTIPVGGRNSKYGTLNKVITLVEITIAGGGVQIGATYAYSLECFIWPDVLPSWLISEDRVLPFRAAILGRVRYVNQELVKYRLAATEFESTTKACRVHGYNHPLHFDLLLQQIVCGKHDGKLGRLKAFFLIMLLHATKITTRLQGKQGITKQFGRLLYMLLRMSRKFAVTSVLIKSKIWGAP